MILLRFTPEPLATVALAARLCYLKTNIAELAAGKDLFQYNDLVRNVVERGHESVLEHVSFTFGVAGLSRAASHQLVRHRLASYSQQSQRYVRYDEIAPVIPPSITQSPEALAAFTAAMDANKSAYAKLIELGVPPEDARYVLPNATPTQIMITMNVRELRHFFKMRLCTRAQWEIRDLARKMLELCRGVESLLFKDVGPNCLLDSCREGKQSCGKPWSRGGEPQD